MKDKVNKIDQVIINILRIIIIFLFFIKVVRSDFEHIHYLLTTFIFTFYNHFMLKFLHLQFSCFIRNFILIYIFLSQVLGRTFNFYMTIPWWDILLHTLAGILFYFLGKEIMLLLNKQQINKILLFLFPICFSIAMGTLWEILEFTYDWIFIKNTQEARGLVGRDALIDTMSDLIVLCMGTFFSVIADLLLEKTKTPKKINKANKIKSTIN